jgi:hypothetical protein
MIMGSLFCFRIVSRFAAQIAGNQLRIVPQFWAPSHQYGGKNTMNASELNVLRLLFWPVVSELFQNYGVLL